MLDEFLNRGKCLLVVIRAAFAEVAKVPAKKYVSILKLHPYILFSLIRFCVVARVWLTTRLAKKGVKSALGSTCEFYQSKNHKCKTPG